MSVVPLAKHPEKFRQLLKNVYRVPRAMNRVADDDQDDEMGGLTCQCAAAIDPATLAAWQVAHAATTVAAAAASVGAALDSDHEEEDDRA